MGERKRRVDVQANPRTVGATLTCAAQPDTRGPPHFLSTATVTLSYSVPPNLPSSPLSSLLLQYGHKTLVSEQLPSPSPDGRWASAPMAS